MGATDDMDGEISEKSGRTSRELSSYLSLGPPWLSQCAQLIGECETTWYQLTNQLNALTSLLSFDGQFESARNINSLRLRVASMRQ